jgi:RNA polymerase sigma-70 factor, ECF subfamily
MGVLLEQHRAALHAHALKILGYTALDDIEDLVQETFLLAVSKISQLQHPDAFRGWLHAILRNLCYGHLRRSRLAVRPLNDSLAEGTEDPSCSSAEIQDQVWAALELLPEHLRATVLLRYFGRMNSYEEIALALAVPVGTVRSRLNTARAHLVAAFRTAALQDVGSLLERHEQRARDYLTRWGMLHEGKLRPVLELYSEGVTMVFSPRLRKHGRAQVEQLLRKDHADGVAYDVHQVLFSGNVSIFEFSNINPPHAPFHCPPQTVLVSFHDEQVITRTHVYEAPRPNR